MAVLIASIEFEHIDFSTFTERRIDYGNNVTVNFTYSIGGTSLEGSSEMTFSEYRDKRDILEQSISETLGLATERER